MKTTALILALIAGMADARSYGSLLSPSRRYHYSRSSPDSLSLLGDIFTTPVFNVNSLMRQQQRVMEHISQSSTPKYSITEDAETGMVELMMEIPGVSANDLDVTIIDGKVLRVSGSRKHIRHGSVYESQFEQSFEIDNIDANKLIVNLANGILTARAPKREKSIKRIPIITEDESGVPEIQPQKFEQDSTVETMNTKEETVSELDGLTITEE